MHPLSYFLFVIVIVFQQVESPIIHFWENSPKTDVSMTAVMIYFAIHQPFSKFVFHSNTKIGKLNRVSGSVRQCNDNKSAVRMEIKKEIQHSTLLERCSSILADAESARVKSDEQDNHFPPLTALDREGAWLRKISKRHLVM